MTAAEGEPHRRLAEGLPADRLAPVQGPLPAFPAPPILLLRDLPTPGPPKFALGGEDVGEAEQEGGVRPVTETTPFPSRLPFEKRGLHISEETSDRRPPSRVHLPRGQKRHRPNSDGGGGPRRVTRGRRRILADARPARGGGVSGRGGLV